MQWCEQDLLAEREKLLNLECFPRQPGLGSRVHGAFPGRRDSRIWCLARVKPELVHSANSSRDFFYPTLVCNLSRVQAMKLPLSVTCRACSTSAVH